MPQNNYTTGAKCPNHFVPLTDCNFKDNVGICPISGVRFTFDAEHAEKTKKLKLNAMGQMVETADWKVVGND